MTRLADVTRLDRVGLPVWQTIRPLSRALSVHQGKGARHIDAQLGALLEAVESDAAERFDEPGPVAAWDELSPAVKPVHLEDFGRDRSTPPSPDEPIRWVEARRLDGRPFLVPFACVSLDFTVMLGTPFERASAGLATGATEEEGRRAALLELVERDAVSRFRRLSRGERLERELRLESVRLDWFDTLYEHLSSLDLELRVFAFDAPSRIPVVGALVVDEAREARPYAGCTGYAAHPDPRFALFRAVAEALQARLTYIAGARDDCWPWLYTDRPPGITITLAPPRAPGFDERDFTDMSSVASDFASIAAAVEHAHETPAFVTIARPPGLAVERAFVPGMGSLVKGPRE